MANTMNLSLGRAAPLSSVRRCNALASRPARLVRNNRMAVRAEADKSVNSQTPNADRSKTENIEAGNISNENAEKRADIGKTREPTPSEAQAFDGPAPETINGRLAMLGVVTCLGAEVTTNVGIQEQIAKAPFAILGTFVLISLASYIPIFRGYTRKEPFANGIWTPKAENWNGRTAMIGFTGIVLTEALAGKSVLEFYGLQHGVDPAGLP
ncbi:hypothetical protein WJX77_003777 [Trebouxia sp. C0004]